MATKPKIFILGGYGSYGRLISQQLARLENTQIIIAGRNPEKRQSFAQALGVDFVACDAANASELSQTIQDVYLVINAAGPFQATDYSVPALCLEAGCHYIDLGDGRDYVDGFRQLDALAKKHNRFACTGCSTSPAITGAMVASLKPQLQLLQSIKIALNAGNKNQAGHSTVASILDYVGKPVRVWRDQIWREDYGWGDSEFVNFPAPVGRRRIQLCDVPDLALFPQAFEADTVLFKAGLELTFFNYALSALAQIKRTFKKVNLVKLTDLLILSSHLFKRFGSFHGCVAVWATNNDGATKSVAIVAPKDGPRVPASPAILMAQKIATSDWTTYGAYPCLGFLNLNEIMAHLEQFGIFLVGGDENGWQTG